jgi:hypothetical protein
LPNIIYKEVKLEKSRIAQLLHAKQPLFGMSLRQLEERTGKKGVDAALAAELVSKSALAIKKMGLKENCTGPELYEGLIRKVAEHDQHICQKIGAKSATNVAEIVPLVMKQIDQIDMPRNCFALKHQKAIELMGKKPPQKLMEHLGYSSFTEMVEKEDLAELFIAIRFTEGSDWLDEFNTVYEGLRGEDFEDRPIKLVHFQRSKWQGVADHFIEKKKHINTHSKEMGVVAILAPEHEHMRGIAIKVLTLTLHYYNEVRLYSSFFKLLKDKKNFGELVTETLIADTPDLPLIEGQYIHWEVIQRYYGKIGEADKHPEIFEPHLQPEDLHWRAAEAILYKIDPELEFWKDMDYVGLFKEGDTLTFNLMDVALSYANEVPYESRLLYHFTESLWNELFARYVGQKVLQQQLLEKLDNAMVKPEELIFV